MTRRLDPEQSICGHRAKDVRDLLRRLERTRGLTAELAIIHAARHSARPRALYRALLKSGYLQVDESPAARMHREESAAYGEAPGTYLRLTPRAEALLPAVAYRPIQRAAAQRAVGEFLGRVQATFAPDWPLAYRVEKVYVFGSYLRATPTLNDIDLILQLEPADPTRQSELQRARIDAAFDAGRTFGNIAEEVCWPYTEVEQFLRAKSQWLRFHSLNHRDFVSPTLQIWPLLPGGPQPLARAPRRKTKPTLSLPQLAGLAALVAGGDPASAIWAVLTSRQPPNSPHYIAPNVSPWRTMAVLESRGLMEKQMQGRRYVYAPTPLAVETLAPLFARCDAQRALLAAGAAWEVDEFGKLMTNLMNRYPLPPQAELLRFNEELAGKRPRHRRTGR